MNSQALMLRRIRYGWAIDLSGGTRLAHFRGPGARTRAQRYLVRLGQTGRPIKPMPRTSTA